MLKSRIFKVEDLAPLVSNDRLELTLMPTEQCNFRCTYCYEDFKLNRMSEDTISGITNLLTRRIDELNQLYIGWFGGEPLLASDIVLRISEFATNLTKARSNVSFGSGITTNGYLLSSRLFEQLVSVNVTNFQISLDGTKDKHDKRRKKIDGSGSFEQIWTNLCNMKESGHKISVLLRVHFDMDTVDDIESLLLQIKREFGTDSRFRVFLKGIKRLGGPNDSLLNPFTEEEEKSVRKFLMKHTNEDATAYEGSPVCYASKANSLVIRADGSLAKCTVALNDPRNSVGRININGTLTINNNRFRLWLTGLETLDPETLSCPLQFLGKE